VDVCRRNTLERLPDRINIFPVPFRVKPHYTPPIYLRRLINLQIIRPLDITMHSLPREELQSDHTISLHPLICYADIRTPQCSFFPLFQLSLHDVPSTTSALLFSFLLFSLHKYCKMLLGLVLLSLPFQTAAQQIVNGQIYTPGIAIVDSPQPNTPLGGDFLQVALDVTSNGQLQLPPYPSNPISAIYNITIFLSSYTTGWNFTISNGTASAGNASLGEIMDQEPGSTVKHVNWVGGTLETIAGVILTTISRSGQTA